MSISSLYTKTVSPDYNCAHFVADAFKVLNGKDITEQLKGFLLPLGKRSTSVFIRKNFKRIDTPVDNCIVAMHSPKVEPHVGLYRAGKGESQVMHLTSLGVHFVPLEIATFGFSQVRYYQCLV